MANDKSKWLCKVLTVSKGVRDPPKGFSRDVQDVFHMLTNLGIMPLEKGKYPNWFLMGGLAIPAHIDSYCKSFRVSSDEPYSSVYRVHDDVDLGLNVLYLGEFTELMKEQGYDLCVQKFMGKLPQHPLSNSVTLLLPEEFRQMHDNWVNEDERKTGKRFYIYRKTNPTEVVRSYFGCNSGLDFSDVITGFNEGRLETKGLGHKLRLIRRGESTSLSRYIDVHLFSQDFEGFCMMPGINLYDLPVCSYKSKAVDRSELAEMVDAFGVRIPVMSPDLLTASKSRRDKSTAKDSYDIDVLHHCLVQSER